MNLRHPMGVIHPFSIKNISYDEIDLKLFYFHGTICFLKLNIPFIHFMPLVSFYTPCKHQKTYGFLMVSGGIERDYCHEMVNRCSE